MGVVYPPQPAVLLFGRGAALVCAGHGVQRKDMRMMHASIATSFIDATPAM